MSSSNRGYFIKKRTAVFIVIGTIAFIIIIGLIAGLAPSRKCSEETSTVISSTSPLPTETTTITTSELWKNSRLPSHIFPLHYHLILQPVIDKDIFNGTVYIDLDITEQTNIIILHGNRLEIDDVRHSFVDNSKRNITILRVFKYDENEYWVIELNRYVSPGLYTLGLEFKGKFEKNVIVGFYKSSYTTGNETRYLVSSKFQPTYARRAFPCFDEPGFKSNYSISIIHDSNLEALSNMPVKEKTTYYHTGLTKTVFETSVKMVTYLVCFIVSDFQYQEEYVGKTQVRIFASPNRIEDTSFALERATYVLKYFEDYFNISYPLPKLDLAAMPQYPSGATEHWGLITFREANLLYNEKEVSAFSRQRVATVIAHELAHMWFGNLVTLKWWNDLWLNEGFASYIEYKGLMNDKPAWNMMDQFLVNELQPVLKVDASHSSHPVIVEVHNPDEITSIFDIISYNKGASAIRFLEDFMGEEKFRSGISEFLKLYAFDNAVTDDLWEVLSKHTNFSIKMIMDNWLTKAGFPLVTVSNIGKIYTLKQEKFINNFFPENNNDTWYIPIRYITNNNNIALEWMKPESKEITVEIEDEWVKFNWKQIGYYRIDYGEKWNYFADIIKKNHTTFQSADRSHFLDDVFNLAKAGYLNYNITLNFATYLKDERDFVPWITAVTELSYLRSIFIKNDTIKDIQNYIRELIDPVLNDLTWLDSNSSDTSQFLNSRLRPYIINLACNCEHEKCLDEARELFNSWKNDNERISPNLRSIVYGFGMYNGGTEDDWDYLWNKSKEATTSQEQLLLYYGMASVNNTELLQRLIDRAWNEIKQQDYFTVLKYISGNTEGTDIVWNYVRENWPKFVDRFTVNDRQLGRLIPSITSSFSTKDHLEEMMTFFNKYPDAGAGENGRKEALENVKNRIEWLKIKEPEIKLYFGSLT